MRPFRPDRDDEAWLRVNNRAFSWHPDQGGWDRERLGPAWPRPGCASTASWCTTAPTGHLDGFCWTKVHPADESAGDPAMGEIFVIAADPDTHGTGLGRALVLAGLDWLADQGPPSACSTPRPTTSRAMRLYDKLGFTVHHSDAGYAP